MTAPHGVDHLLVLRPDGLRLGAVLFKHGLHDPLGGTSRHLVVLAHQGHQLAHLRRQTGAVHLNRLQLLLDFQHFAALGGSCLFDATDLAVGALPLVLEPVLVVLALHLAAFPLGALNVIGPLGVRFDDRAQDLFGLRVAVLGVGLGPAALFTLGLGHFRDDLEGGLDDLGVFGLLLLMVVHLLLLLLLGVTLGLSLGLGVALHRARKAL